MNSEELELSLRTEFESYLKGYLADLKQEVSEFQRNFEAEFEKHKSQTDEALSRLVERFERSVEFDQAFNESVVEHLRLARDEGATITAVAIGEAEKLKEETAAAAAPAVQFDKLRDAINEISSKTSQAEILKSLVDHASDFAPRGAFFIVKNEQFIGWRTFGAEATVDEATVRSTHLPASADTLLAEAVSTLATAAGTAGSHADDRSFLEPLDFGTPDRMYAIPLIARGRGVAVLYADYGNEGLKLQPEALETLVRVAGLTVELAAAGVQPAPVSQPIARPAETAPAREEQRFQPETEPATEEVEAPTAQETTRFEQEAAPSYQEEQTFAETPAQEYTETPAQEQAPGFDEAASYQEAPTFEEPAPAFEQVQAPEVEEQVTFEEVREETPAAGWEYTQPVAETVEQYHPQEPAAFEHEQGSMERSEQPAEEVSYFEPVQEQAAEPAFTEPEAAYEFVPVEEAREEFPEVIDEPVSQPAAEFVPQTAPAVEFSNGSPAQAVVGPAPAEAAPRPRYRDRNVDLPIEVPEEERRLHTDARRFARLLVSEIKLYNEQKVADGRSAGDLYDRLREAIDRSREMYDKRVQQHVADKFDYFHYELVNSLAEGDDVKLGASYPGSKVPA